LNLKKCLVLFVALIIGLCVPAEQVYATTLTNNNLGIRLEFPEKYAVISKAGVHEKSGLTNQEIQQLTQILTDSNIELIAISQSFSKEINIESYKDANYNTFTFLTDAELSEFGKELREATIKEAENMEGAENVKIQDPAIYHHSQTNFILLESTNLSMHTFQYFTIYNGKGYRILLVDYSGDIDTREAESFIDDIKFLESPINNTSVKGDQGYEDIMVKVGAGVIMGAVGGIPYLLSRKKKNEANNSI